jgi:hypothetical protein
MIEIEPMMNDSLNQFKSSIIVHHSSMVPMVPFVPDFLRKQSATAVRSTVLVEIYRHSASSAPGLTFAPLSLDDQSRSRGKRTRRVPSGISTRIRDLPFPRRATWGDRPVRFSGGHSLGSDRGCRPGDAPSELVVRTAMADARGRVRGDWGLHARAGRVRAVRLLRPLADISRPALDLPRDGCDNRGG